MPPRRLLLLVSLSAGLALAQTPSSFDKTFFVTKTTSLSGAAEVITVQHAAPAAGPPPTSAKTVQFISAYLYCSVACTVTLERNGTAATTTTLAIAAVNPKNLNVQTTTSTAYSSSNVGTGTVVSTYQIVAGGCISLDMTLSQLMSNVADNLTFRTNSITGTFQMQLMWYEI